MQTQTELNSLRIDKSRKAPSATKPVARYVVIAIVALVVLIGAWTAYSKVTAPVPVHVVNVQTPATSASDPSSGKEIILTSTGYIIAAHKIEVASKVIGRVAWIGVDKGDRVTKGQVIVRLEDDEYRAQLHQAQGQLANLQAHLAELKNGSRPEEIAKAKADREEAAADAENAKVTLNRTKELVNSGVLAKQSLDDAQAKYDSAVAKVNSLQKTLDLAVLGPRQEEMQQLLGQIEQAKGTVDYAQTQLDNTIIKAPVTGTILDRNVEVGEFVTNGFVGDKGAKGYLVTMADLNDLQVELDIPQQDFPKLGPQQKGIVTTDAYPDKTYEGSVEQVSPEADRAKATVQVKVRVLNPDGLLRPDMNATVKFYNDAPQSGGGQTARPTLTIPPSALQNGAVWIVGPDNRVHKRSVTTAGTTQQGTIVQDGLIGGETLVNMPPADLKENQRITVQQ